MNFNKLPLRVKRLVREAKEIQKAGQKLHVFHQHGWMVGRRYTDSRSAVKSYNSRGVTLVRWNGITEYFVPWKKVESFAHGS